MGTSSVSTSTANEWPLSDSTCARQAERGSTPVEAPPTAGTKRRPCCTLGNRAVCRGNFGQTARGSCQARSEPSIPVVYWVPLWPRCAPSDWARSSLRSALVTV